MLLLALREFLLLVAAALFARFGFPVLTGNPEDPGLLTAGFVMALTYTGAFAVAYLVANRSPRRAQWVMAPLAWAATFLPAMPGPGIRTGLVFGLAGLLLAGVAALRERNRGLTTFLTYTVAFMAIRWLLVPMVSVSPALEELAIWTGFVYLVLRVLTGLFVPGDGVARRPLPDRVVGLLEGISGLRARPYATKSDGGRDDRGVSVICRDQAEAERVASEVSTRLAGNPVRVSVGEAVEGGVEVTIHPAE